MPQLSVLMPAYNAEETVRHAVVSTLAALPRGSGLLVYDDASTDRTPNILQDLANSDPRLRWHRAERNGGVGVALGWLVDNAESPWIARMDADDVCLPWRFQPAWSVAKLLAVDFCFTGALNVDERLRPLRPTVPWPLGVAAAKYDLVVDNSLFHGGVIARRAALEELGGYRDVEAEDYDLWMRAVAAGFRLLRVPWQGYLYRTHQTQVTQSQGHLTAFKNSPHLAQAHTDLTQLATGRLSTVFPTLSTPAEDWNAHQRAEVLALADALESAVMADSSIRPWDRWLLRRRRVGLLRRMAGGVHSG